MTHGLKTRILVLEDSPNDAELIMYESGKGLKAEFTLTDDFNKFIQHLKTEQFDLILADYHLRNFNGVDALIAARKFDKFIPFIFVSGTMGDEQAVNALKYGATDYVLKHNLRKLPFTINRALNEQKEKKKLESSEKRKQILLEELIRKDRVRSCLFKLSELINDKNLDLVNKLSATTRMMQEGFLYPENVIVSISLDDLRWNSKKIPSKNKKISHKFSKDGSKVEITAYYDSKKMPGNFVKDEVDFIKSVKGQIMNMFDSTKAEEKLITTIIESEERERKRIAIDIHDSLQQTLVITNLNFNIVSNKIESLRPPLENKYLERLKIAKEYLTKAMEESRNIAHELAPHSEAGISEMINALIRNLSKTSGIEFTLIDNAEDEKIDSSQRINLFRIVQEAINNVLKHSGASKVKIELTSGFGRLLLSIEDNGVGFNPSKLNQNKNDFGFQNIIHRVKSMGGTFDLKSREGIGTFVKLNIPIMRNDNLDIIK